MDRYVYLLRAGMNHYKVGIALNVLDRIKGIQTGNPMAVHLVASVYIPNAAKVEHELHEWLSLHKADGGREWFELTSEKVLELIEKMTELAMSQDLSKYLEMRNLIARQTKLETEFARMREQYPEREVPEQPTLSVKPKPQDPLHDELLDTAERIVRAVGKASTSMLQRRLKIGYARSARLMDELEEIGVVGPIDGARAREVIIK